jgi:hypothetical protein
MRQKVICAVNSQPKGIIIKNFAKKVKKMSINNWIRWFVFICFDQINQQPAHLITVFEFLEFQYIGSKIKSANSIDKF